MADFYTRNNLARERLENAASPSSLLDHRSREVILRNVFNETKGLRRWRGRDLWSWVGAMTGHGSGYSEQICAEMGWDPAMRIRPDSQLPRATSPTGEKHGD